MRITSGNRTHSDFVAAERVREDREGAVAYFLDAAGRVIGLWKLKTAWYILVRAIREKVRRTNNAQVFWFYSFQCERD